VYRARSAFAKRLEYGLKRKEFLVTLRWLSPPAGVCATAHSIRRRRARPAAP